MIIRSELNTDRHEITVTEFNTDRHEITLTAEIGMRLTPKQEAEFRAYFAEIVDRQLRRIMGAW